MPLLVPPSVRPAADEAPLLRLPASPLLLTLGVVAMM